MTRARDVRQTARLLELACRAAATAPLPPRLAALLEPAQRRAAAMAEDAAELGALADEVLGLLGPGNEGDKDG